MLKPEPVKVSLCMIVKNEAPHLERCLLSVAGVVDELVVVDTGSTDRTVEIAAAHQARLFHFAWRDDFSLARNFSLDQARGEWILHLDADEELETDTRARLRPLLAETRADGLLMTQRNFTAGSDLVRYDDLRITRLFRNRPEFRYEQAIHEQIRPSIDRHGGRVAPSDLVIWHYGYVTQTAQGQQSRARRNLELLEMELAAKPGDAYLHYQVGVTHKSLGHSDLAESHLRQALALDIRALGDEISDNAYMKLAQLTYAAGRHGDAVKYADASLSINPNNTISLYLSALIAVSNGDIKKARGYFARVKQQPDLTEDSQKDIDYLLSHL